MHDLLTDTLPTEWEGRAIDPDFRPMGLAADPHPPRQNQRGQRPADCIGHPALLCGADSGGAVSGSL